MNATAAGDTFRRTDSAQQPRLHLRLCEPQMIRERVQVLANEFPLQDGSSSRDLRWLVALSKGLKHTPYCVEARHGERVIGVLPLMFTSSRLFGRFLVSLPYLNTGGVRVTNQSAVGPLIDKAVELADELDVRYLELRHETKYQHERLTRDSTSKVHMRLNLPESADELWSQLKAKVRNQVRKGEKSGCRAIWGGKELLPDFYQIFCHNMRDLGTPPFGSSLFDGILDSFPNDAEFCVVRIGDKPVAAALLIDGPTTVEVPSASSLRHYNKTNANMFMYWQLLKRAIERKRQVFDFGRSSRDTGTYRFKQQWGAQPQSAIWQYYLRKGDIGDMRPDSGRFRPMIAVWKRLPVPVTRWLGPSIVRGIP